MIGRLALLAAAAVALAFPPSTASDGHREKGTASLQTRGHSEPIASQPAPLALR
jgi:hypothetical protein